MSVEPSTTEASLDSVADDPLNGGPISLNETTVTAFVGRTQRGPVNRAVRVRSYDEYRRVFGSHTPFSFLSYAVLHYFISGGRVAVIVRVINRGTRASLSLPTADGVLRLQARSPGSHELIRASVDYDGIGPESPCFNLALQRVARMGSAMVEDQEVYRNLSMADDHENFVVNALHNSALATVAGPVPRIRPDATLANNPGDAIPYIRMASDGSDGDELTDYDLIGSNEEGTGLFALDRVDRLSLLCVPLGPGQPGIGLTTLVAADRYCRVRNAMLILDPPWHWRSPESALLGVRDLGFSSDHALLYFPRVRSRESWERWPDGLPACGAIAGVLAAEDERSGVGKPLDPEHAVLRGGLAPQGDVSAAHQRMLIRHGVNVLRRLNGHTVVVGDVTLAGDRTLIDAWGHLNQRRLALFVVDTLQRHTRWAAGPGLTGDPLTQLRQQVRTFLIGLMEQGVLAARTPARAFFLRVEPPGPGSVTMTVGLALAKPGDFEVFQICHSPDGSTTRSAHGSDLGLGVA